MIFKAIIISETKEKMEELLKKPKITASVFISQDFSPSSSLVTDHFITPVDIVPIKNDNRQGIFHKKNHSNSLKKVSLEEQNTIIYPFFINPASI